MSAKIVSISISAASRVKLIRLRGKMTQQKLGDLIGVAASTISSWERERSHPSRLARIRLGEYERGEIKRPVQITWRYK